MININATLRVSGRFKAIKHTGHTYDDAGSVVKWGDVIQETPFGRNTITLTGFKTILYNPDNNTTVKLVAGTDNTSPAESDTTLGNYLGYTDVQASFNVSKNSTPDVDGYVRVSTTYRMTFNPGALGSSPVNVAEAGVVLGAGIPTALTPISAHGLLVDDVGSPTTVSVDPTFEYLDIVWELTYWVPAETSQTIDLDILGVATSHTITIRPEYFTNTDSGLSWAPATSLPSYRVLSNATGFGNYAVQVMSTNGLGSISEFPPNDSGLAISLRVPNNISMQSYVDGAKSRTATCTWLPLRANISGGIQSINVYHEFYAFQVAFSPKLGKTSDYQLDLTFKLSLANK